MSQDMFSFRLDLLRDEIAKIQDKITTYDDLSFKIKGWAVTLWTGILGFAISQKSTFFLLAGVPLLGAFWLLDAYFKSFQQRSMARMGYIENFLNGLPGQAVSGLTEAFEKRSFESFVVYDPIGRQTCKVNHEFKKRFSEKVNYKRCFWIRNVRTLYLTLIVVSVLPTIVKIIF